MREAMHVTGTVLLGLAGCGVGYLIYFKKLEQWRSVRLFLRLLQYLLDGIRYLGRPCTELLQMAAANLMFNGIDISGCISYCEIPIPERISQSVNNELRAGFALIERSNSACACAELQRMIERCKMVEGEALTEARHACSLYPKLGFCLGVLIAVVLA